MKKDLSSLVELLSKGAVEFAVVGGYAGVVHGCSYVTADVDICCLFSEENLLRLQKALSDVHPVHRMTPGHQALRLTEENCGQFKNLYLDTDIGQLDCLSFVEGVGSFLQVKESSEEVEIGGVAVYVLGLEALIKAKKAMGRPNDKEAVLQLEAIQKLREEK